MSANFLFFILICSVAYVSSIEELSCHLQDYDLYDGTISVTYDREELSIYRYNNTRFVNFLLRGVLIKFNGKFLNEIDVDFKIDGIKSNVEGIGKIEKNERGSALTSCHFNLRKNAKFINNVHLSIQVRIIELAHICIKSKLCYSFGSPQQDDYIRAKIDSHDFGENSIMLDMFANNYPNLNFPTTTGNNLQNTINLLSDFWLASLITQTSKKQLGQIILPDVNETMPGIPNINQGYFRLNHGTFGNLRNFIRSKDIIISHKGLQFSIEGEYRLSEAHVHFDKYDLKYGIFSTNGKIDMQVNGLTFYVKLIMNYNSFPCKITVSTIKSEIGEITFKLIDNGVFDSVINELTNSIVNRYIPNLISLIETQIKEAIKQPMKQFSCEKFRP